MAKGSNRRRTWKALAKLKRTPGGFVPTSKKRDKRGRDEAQRGQTERE
jgi:hypothetical protein